MGSSANGVAVGVVLAVDRVAGGGDARLVERHGNHLVAAEVADVAKLDGQVVARLPLDVQRVVIGVGQLVGAVVDAKRDRLADRR